MAAARAIFFQAARDFTAPFGFGLVFRGGDGGGAGGGVCGDAEGYRLSRGVIFDEWEITEGTFFDVLEREGATLRAYSYHWSVLRCGGSSGGTFRCYHSGERRGAGKWRGCDAKQITQEAGKQGGEERWGFTAETRSAPKSSKKAVAIAGAEGAC